VAAWCTLTRFLPASLAAYSAWSEAAISWSLVRPSRGKTAMPNEAVTAIAESPNMILPYGVVVAGARGSTFEILQKTLDELVLWLAAEIG